MDPLRAMGVSNNNNNNNSSKCQSFYVFLRYYQLNEPLALKSFDYVNYLLLNEIVVLRDIVLRGDLSMSNNIIIIAYTHKHFMYML
jgi:hypothetical protein